MAQSNSNQGNYIIIELSEYLNGFLHKPRNVHGDTNTESSAGSNNFDHNKIKAIVEYLKVLHGMKPKFEILEKKVVELEKKVVELKAEKKKVEDDLHKCETELSQKNLELEETKDKLSKKNSELDKIKEEISVIKKAQKKETKALNAKSQENDKLKDELKKIKEELDSLKNAPRYNYAQSPFVNSNIQTVNYAGDHSYKELSENLKLDNEELNKKISKLEKELEDAKTKIHDLESEIDIKTTKNIDLENQLNSLISPQDNRSIVSAVAEESSLATNIQHTDG